MAVDSSRTLRGALAGAAAAAVWAAQQPLDMKLFGVRYDDTALLASALPGRVGRSSGPGTVAAGWALHLANGAVFGAVYANVAPSIPLPPWARGPAAGMIENAATWPLTRFIPALHPRADTIPRLWGSNAALAQATWRHLLFGTVMGEIERRLNPPTDVEGDPEPVVSAASNGHGSADRIVPMATPSATS